jgi:hypothetical protein
MVVIKFLAHGFYGLDTDNLCPIRKIRVLKKRTNNNYFIVIRTMIKK